ncbi:MAG: hypothetical protein FJ278_17290, partial [Planctomycetes bacterium]|nr:hypothetical protein [Planctomycetota bacterium]
MRQRSQRSTLNSRWARRETRFLAEIGFLVLLLNAWVMAQEPGAKAVHRAGQTFITWREVEGAKEYRIYRAAEPVRDLAKAV